MKHPNKWRDTVDPFALAYSAFVPKQVLGYPHAGNDVFYMRGCFNGEEIRAYVKAARQRGASAETIENERRLLMQLDLPNLPVVLDHGDGDMPFIVTRELRGERLSAIVGENRGMESLSYMAEYGETLAMLHGLKPDVGEMKDRRFFHPPTDELLAELELLQLKPFFADPPEEQVRCFCHGDMHYANILWDKHRISGILDFELSGCGNRDFDIAWALFVRPGQRFLKTEEERLEFLRGYARRGEYNAAAVDYYIAQCYVWFLQFSADDADYCSYVRGALKRYL